MWRGSARWLALPCVFACGHSGAYAWVGTQDCSVGIPPEQAKSVDIPPVSLLLATEFTPSGDGFYLQNFTLGPIGGFACSAVPLLVTAHYTREDGTQTPRDRPVLARAIALDPFECRATDGRTYTLTGTGQADLWSAFINMTFSAWLAAGQATLTCSTRFVQAAADAGVAAVRSDPEVQPALDPGAAVPADPAQMVPDAGAAAAPN